MCIVRYTSISDLNWLSCYVDTDILYPAEWVKTNKTLWCRLSDVYGKFDLWVKDTAVKMASYSTEKNNNF